MRPHRHKLACLVCNLPGPNIHDDRRPRFSLRVPEIATERAILFIKRTYIRIDMHGRESGVLYLKGLLKIPFDMAVPHTPGPISSLCIKFYPGGKKT